MSQTAFIPLALTIMLGPQILVAMLLITRKDAIQSSITYIAAITSTLIATTYLYHELAIKTQFHTISISGRPILKYILAGILVYIMIRTIVNRNKITNKPNWITDISTCSKWKVFLIGVMLIAVMPSDIAIEFTVGSLLDAKHQPFTDAIPFFATVMGIATIPLIIYLVTGQRGHAKLKKMNTWLNSHGYLINVVVLAVFIYIILK